MAKKINFEDKLSSLETIVNKLESNDVSLEEMLKLYEEGIKISDECDKFLKDAEQKILILSKKENEIKETEFNYDE